MRFNLPALLLLIAIAALTFALFLKRAPDKLTLIGGYIETWELQESAGLESQWPDNSQPPRLSVAEAYEAALGICNHLNSAKQSTGIGYWEPVTVSLERLLPVNSNRWAYFVRIRGTSYPERPGRNACEEVICMILLDKTVVFDSGNCPDRLLEVMRSFPEIVDTASTANERSGDEGGVRQENAGSM